jgi:nucleoside-diphosphate-sugar epimerase
MADFLILGAGFTAGRVARRLAEAGAEVVATNRRPSEIPGARCLALDLETGAGLTDLASFLSNRTAILHSIPTFAGTPDLVAFLRPFRPRRIVYLSTTGVYGAADRVDEQTEPRPDTDAHRRRIDTEAALADGPWSAMVLRPAGIYGPGRGVHWSAKRGQFRPPSGNGVVSRIHVDDLAEHAVRALRGDATGAFPVADEAPCPSLEVATWTCAYLGIPLVAGEPAEPRRGRIVDGSAVRALLGVTLQYPSYREGVPACLEAENASAGEPGRPGPAAAPRLGGALG